MNYTTEELELYSEEVLTRVSNNVIKYRNQKGLSQLQLAIELGLSGGAYIGRAELRTKNHQFNIKNLSKISKILDVNIKDFFD